MTVYVNDGEYTLDEGCTVNQLLGKLKYGTYAAVWINGDQVLRREYATKVLKEGDKVTVIRPLGGG